MLLFLPRGSNALCTFINLDSIVLFSDMFDAFTDTMDAFKDTMDAFKDAMEACVDAFTDAMDAFKDAMEVCVDASKDAMDAFKDAYRAAFLASDKANPSRTACDISSSKLAVPFCSALTGPALLELFPASVAPLGVIHAVALDACWLSRLVPNAVKPRNAATQHKRRKALECIAAVGFCTSV
jgi:hypothetical protein